MNSPTKTEVVTPMVVLKMDAPCSCRYDVTADTAFVQLMSDTISQGNSSRSAMELTQFCASTMYVGMEFAMVCTVRWISGTIIMSKNAIIPRIISTLSTRHKGRRSLRTNLRLLLPMKANTRSSSARISTLTMKAIHRPMIKGESRRTRNFTASATTPMF